MTTHFADVGGGPPRGALERSLAALTIGVAQGERARRDALDDTYTGEYEQQVHEQLSGEAASGWGFTDAHVAWELPFLYAPLQRRVPFTTPHFTYGIEITSGTEELIVIHAHVIGWTVTEEQWYVGARVRFGVCAPASDPSVTIPYQAIAHLSFQGFATPAEGDELTPGVT
jgi:hypothetical protein